MVRKGYIVFIYDPVSQGERLQYLDMEGDLVPNRCEEIHLRGKGMGAIVSLFAGLLSDAVKKITLVNGLLSYHELTQAVVYKWPLSHYVPGILEYIDLPDIIRALEDKDLNIIDPCDETMKVWDKKACRKHAEELGINVELISFS